MKSATITLALFTTLALPGAAAAGDDLFDLPRVRAGLASAPGPAQVTPTALRLVKTTRLDRVRARETNDADSVWDGLLIGAGAGFAGGLVWGPPATDAAFEDDGGGNRRPEPESEMSLYARRERHIGSVSDNVEHPVAHDGTEQGPRSTRIMAHEPIAREREDRPQEIGKQHGQYESPKRDRPIDALREETDRQMADKHGRPPGGGRLSFPG